MASKPVGLDEMFQVQPSPSDGDVAAGRLMGGEIVCWKSLDANAVRGILYESVRMRTWDAFCDAFSHLESMYAAEKYPMHNAVGDVIGATLSHSASIVPKDVIHLLRLGGEYLTGEAGTVKCLQLRRIFLAHAYFLGTNQTRLPDESAGVMWVWDILSRQCGMKHGTRRRATSAKRVKRAVCGGGVVADMTDMFYHPSFWSTACRITRNHAMVERFYRADIIKNDRSETSTHVCRSVAVLDIIGVTSVLFHLFHGSQSVERSRPSQVHAWTHVLGNSTSAGALDAARRQSETVHQNEVALDCKFFFDQLDHMERDAHTVLQTMMPRLKPML